jgi:hypothetical protein
MVVSTKRERARKIAASVKSGPVEHDPRVRAAQRDAEKAVREHEQAERDHADALAAQNAIARQAADEPDAGKRRRLAADAVKARERADTAALAVNVAEQRVDGARRAVTDALALVRAERVEQLVGRHEAAQATLVGYVVGLVNAAKTCRVIGAQVEAMGGKAPASVLPPNLAEMLRTAGIGRGGAVDAALRDAEAAGIISGVGTDRNGLWTVLP